MRCNSWKLVSEVRNALVFSLLCYKNLHELQKKPSMKPPFVVTLSSTKTQINKTQQRNLDSSCISFLGGSGKTWKVENIKWQKTSVFSKQISSCCVFIYQFTGQNFDQSWTKLSFVGCNRERWQAVTGKEEKIKLLHAFRFFSCNLV